MLRFVDLESDGPSWAERNIAPTPNKQQLVQQKLDSSGLDPRSNAYATKKAQLLGISNPRLPNPQLSKKAATPLTKPSTAINPGPIDSDFFSDFFL